MKKIVVFGGGTGLSHILKGLKLFPVHVSAIISVADNGKSTGILKEELNIPAVGDVGKVLISMANVSDDMTDLLSYRFTNSSVENHPIRNLLLAALIETQGSLSKATNFMCNLLNIKGSILPITDEKVELIGVTKNHDFIYGEEEITRSSKDVKEVKYNKEFKVNSQVIKAVKEADLIIISPGSLLTSITPHLIIPEVSKAINESKAKKMYISNMFTQPGETDNFKVSDHLKYLKRYINIDVVISNNKSIPKKTLVKYEKKEQKDYVPFDKKEIDKMNIEYILDKLYCFEEGTIKHDSLKTAYHIFSYLMEGVKNDIYNEN